MLMTKLFVKFQASTVK